MTMLAVGTMMMTAGQSRAGLKGADALLRHVPNDRKIVLVVDNAEQLDKTLMAWTKRIVPGGAPPGGPFGELKDHYPIAAWLDLTKPIAIDFSDMEDDAPVIWGTADGFAGKAAAHEGATEENGIWHFPLDLGDQMFAKELSGGVVVMSTKKAFVEKAKVKGKSLADLSRERRAAMADANIALILGVDALRPEIKSGLAMVRGFMPMAMLQIGKGMDPQSSMDFANMLNAMFDGANQMVDQFDYLDVSAKLTNTDANLAALAGFMDGPIRQYLTTVKPARKPLLSRFDAQPYVMAGDFDLPGGMLAMAHYFKKRMDMGGATAGEGDKKEAEEAAGGDQAGMFTKVLDLYAIMNGGGFVMKLQKTNLSFIADYDTTNASRFVALMDDMVELSNKIYKTSDMAMKYEPLGQSSVNGIEVRHFGLKVSGESKDEMAQIMAQVYGENVRMSLGATSPNTVRFCLGPPSLADKVFKKSVTKPLNQERYAKAALGNLPAKRNGVVLLDFAAMAPMMSAITGGPPAGALPPGPPIATSLDMSGGDLRLDVHIPVRAIERIVQAFSAEHEPM